MVVAGSSSPVSSVDGPVCDRRLASTGHGGGLVVIGQSAIKTEGRREVGLKKATTSIVAGFFCDLVEHKREGVKKMKGECEECYLKINSVVRYLIRFLVQFDDQMKMWKYI